MARTPLLLVGQAPGKGPGSPLQGRCGRFLASLAGITFEEYLQGTERVNLLPRYEGPSRTGKGDRFPLQEARVEANLLLPRLEGREVILLGTGVARAFRVSNLPLMAWEPGRLGASRLARLPHPSGVNRWWNDGKRKAGAARFLSLYFTRMDRRSKSMSLLDYAGIPEEERPSREEWWEEYWKGMPEYEIEEMRPFRSIKVHFRNQEDVDRFKELVGQDLTGRTGSIWFPIAGIGSFRDKVWVHESETDLQGVADVSEFASEDEEEDA